MQPVGNEQEVDQRYECVSLNAPKYVPGWGALVKLVDNDELDLGLELASEEGAETGPALRSSPSPETCKIYGFTIKGKIPTIAKTVSANAGRTTRQDVI
jgi:hypothetical protein